MKKWYVKMVIFIALLLLVAAIFSAISPKSQKIKTVQNTQSSLPIVSPTPTPFIFKSYTAPAVERKEVYKIVMIGDSMTAALGPHGGGLSEYMNSIYKKTPQDPQRIIIDNYAKSSNILAVNDQLNQKTTISEYTFGPLLSDTFDLILVESFGYNPLSQFGLEEGIKKQNEALDTLMKILITTHPKSAIVFVTTIAPNLENYAKNTEKDTKPEDRTKQAQERIAYLKNHIEYAKSHNIPLINIYEKSLTTKGDGNMKYINTTDDIHPSFEGVDFIGHEIGNFIKDNQILPL